MSRTLAELPLDDYLPFLAQRRASGTLNVHTRSHRKRVYLVDGLVAGTSSGNPTEMLGHFLLGLGLISEEQLTEAMELQGKLTAPLGRILERTGALTAADLEQALIAQAKEVVLELFLVPLTERVFLENVLPADHPLALRLDLPSLVADGVRRRKSFEEFMRLLGSLSAVVVRTDATHPADLDARDIQVLAELDGKRSIDAVAMAGRRPPFHVAALLARGVREGFLAVAAAAPTTPAPEPGALAAAAGKALEAGDLRTCRSLLDQLRDADTSGAFRGRRDQLVRRVAEALAARRIAGNLIPWVISQDTGSSLPGLSPAEAFTLSRINDRWSLREIQRLIPVEELHYWVIVDTLHQLRLIELRHPRGGPALAAVLP